MLSIVGIILGLVLMIYLAMKGVNSFLFSLASAVVVIIFSQMPVVETISTYWMGGFTGFLKGYFVLFMVSSIFAMIMGESGACDVIAVKLSGLARKGKTRKTQCMIAILSVGLVQAILTYGGINLFVVIFLLVTLTKNIFEELDLPWHLCYLGCFCSGSFTMAMLPGTPSVQNIIPTAYLGTNAMAAPVVGIICSIVCVVLSVLYTNYEVGRTLKKNEGFLPSGSAIAARIGDTDEKKEIPNYNIIYCLLPCIILFIVLNVLNQDAIVAVFCGCVSGLILFFKTLKPKQYVKCFEGGIANAVSVACSVSAVVGFGTVVAATTGYASIIGALNNVGGSPLWQIVIIVNVAAGAAGSASGGLGIFFEQFTDYFLDLGLAPQVIHRLSVISSCGLDSLPHNGAVVSGMACFGLTHKQVYKYVFIENCVITVICAALAVLLFSMGLC